MKEKKTVIVVSHTHWDRAWYLPFETFRHRLAGLVDRLLALFSEPSPFHSFTFDGQMLPIEDYLEIYPERRGEITALVKEGKLIIGPWYSLPDEYLVSPEALIRNLALGLEIAEDLGGAALIGYVPDSFGHINQLPQLLQGFGIDNALFWRGLGDEGEALGNEFIWQSPDGTAVIAIHLSTGYFNASNLGYTHRWGTLEREKYQPDLVPGQLISAAEELAKTSNTNVLLLLNGVDHAGVNEQLPAHIQGANQQNKIYHFQHGSLEIYLEKVRQAGLSRLKMYSGEFNRSRYAFGLKGVYSSRIDISQANAEAQLLLEQYAEPLAAWSWLSGGRYPERFLRQAWRYLLQNHPHDDICGCSVDTVHRENHLRFEWVHQIASPVIADAIRNISRQIPSRHAQGVRFLVFNPLPHDRTETMELELVFLKDDPLPDAFQLLDPAGRTIPFQVLSRKQIPLLDVGSFGTAVSVRLCAVLEQLPACGYQVITARPGEPSSPEKTGLRSFPGGMENEYVKVTVLADGRLDLEDKATGQRYPGLLEYVDVADRGDEYDFDALPNDPGVSTQGQEAEIKTVVDGPLQVTIQVCSQLELPEALDAERKSRNHSRIPCLLQTDITLRAASPRLEIKTVFHNHVKDHRLRVLFPTPLKPKVVHSDGHFWVNSRELAPQAGKDWDQPPAPTGHQRLFLDLSEQGKGIGILNRGLPEYEILPGPNGHTIALTLLRAVGYLSRGDLASRPGGEAGPEGIETPEAQCQGVREFEFAILPHPGDWQSIYPENLSYQAGVISRNMLTQPVLPGDAQPQPVISDPTSQLPPEKSYLRLEPAGLGLSAVKKSVDGSGLIIRLFNPSGDSKEAILRTGFELRKAALCSLSEQPYQELPIAEPNLLRLQLDPGQIATLLIEPGQVIQEAKKEQRQ